MRCLQSICCIFSSPQPQLDEVAEGFPNRALPFSRSQHSRHSQVRFFLWWKCHVNVMLTHIYIVFKSHISGFRAIYLFSAPYILRYVQNTNQNSKPNLTKMLGLNIVFIQELCWLLSLVWRLCPFKVLREHHCLLEARTGTETKKTQIQKHKNKQIQNKIYMIRTGT